MSTILIEREDKPNTLLVRNPKDEISGDCEVYFKNTFLKEKAKAFFAPDEVKKFNDFIISVSLEGVYGRDAYVKLKAVTSNDKR